jgi:hypothetical protein
VSFFCDCEFAVTEGIPEFDRLVSTARYNLSVISGERDREDIVRVADEATRRLAGIEIPETESLVP